MKRPSDKVMLTASPLVSSITPTKRAATTVIWGLWAVMIFSWHHTSLVDPVLGYCMIIMVIFNVSS